MTAAGQDAYLLICGSRTWFDVAPIEAVVSLSLGIFGQYGLVVVTGGAPGADAIGAAVARRLGCGSLVMRAEWDKYGKRAGFVRNEAMVDYLVSAREDGAAAAVVAFTHGSRGTQHTINLARSKGLTVTVEGTEAVSLSR